jgi:1-acyl-sn-glycerol-3-phosphate acyltransferase
MQAAARRLATVSGVLICLALALATAPLWLCFAIATDAVSRGRRTALRCGLFLLSYLLCEALGLLAILAMTPARLLGAARFRDLNRRLQNLWGRALFGCARACFGIRLETEGAEAAATGPILLMMRHATLVDTLIPTLAVSVPFGLDLRYVLKSELLWDPCLDIVGNRMGHFFARRGSTDTAAEIDGVRALARGLGPRDGVLIYPEGTRFTPAKRARVLARFRERGDARALERGEQLRHVLPPRRGGSLALLQAAPDADVVVCAHTGLDAVTHFRDLWRGAAKGRVLRACFWRIPRADIPADDDARADWLHAQWQRVDAWVEANRDPGGDASRAG